MATTLDSIFKDRGTGPYAKSVKVKIVARAEQPVTYKGSDGSDRQSLTVAISDGTTCLRLICYDPAKFQKLTEGQTVILREIIRKTEDELPVIVATKATKIFLSGGIDIPPEHAAAGMLLINPAPAATIPVKQALQSPVKKRVSVRGKIVQEDDVRTVNVKGAEVPIKTVVLQDSSGEAKITLWREMTNSTVRTGDYIMVSDVVVNNYRNETSLSTTSRTKVQKTDAPEEQRRVVVTGSSLDDGKAELLLDSDEVLTIPAELLVKAMPGDNPDIESLSEDGPVTLNVIARGSEIISVTIDQ